MRADKEYMLNLYGVDQFVTDDWHNATSMELQEATDGAAGTLFKIIRSEYEAELGDWYNLYRHMSHLVETSKGWASRVDFKEKMQEAYSALGTLEHAAKQCVGVLSEIPTYHGAAITRRTHADDPGIMYLLEKLELARDSLVLLETLVRTMPIQDKDL